MKETGAAANALVDVFDRSSREGWGAEKLFNQIREVVLAASPADENPEGIDFESISDLKEAFNLNERQSRFVKEFVASGNATASAKAAGYAEKKAECQGWRLQRNVKVKAAIDAEQRGLCRRLNIKPEKIKESLARVAHSNIADFLQFGPNGIEIKDSKNLTRAQLEAVGEVSETVTGSGKHSKRTMRFKLHPKNQANETLARCLAMLTDNTNVRGDFETRVLYPPDFPGQKPEPKENEG